MTKIVLYTNLYAHDDKWGHVWRAWYLNESSAREKTLERIQQTRFADPSEKGRLLDNLCIISREASFGEAHWKGDIVSISVTIDGETDEICFKVAGDRLDAQNEFSFAYAGLLERDIIPWRV